MIFIAGDLHKSINGLPRRAPYHDRRFCGRVDFTGIPRLHHVNRTGTFVDNELSGFWQERSDRRRRVYFFHSDNRSAHFQRASPSVAMVTQRDRWIALIHDSSKAKQANKQKNSCVVGQSPEKKSHVIKLLQFQALMAAAAAHQIAR